MKALDKGVSFDGGGQPSGPRKAKPASAYQSQMITMLNEEYKTTGRVLAPREITDRINKGIKSPTAKLEHDKAKGYISTQITQWKKDNNIMGF